VAAKKKPSVAKKSIAPRGESTRNAFIRVTAQMIDVHGEPSVKLEEVLVETGASVSSLYHHFGSLRGLIEEAQVYRFMIARNLDVDQLKAGIERVSSQKEFVELLRTVLLGMISNARDFNRMRRITALASSESSESMREKLVQVEKESLENALVGMRYAQARGFIPADVDVEVATIWGSTVAFSRVLVHILDNPSLQSRWDTLAVNSILQVFKLDGV
jgi:AcrR family transcriptional regulator